jgi:hypothetical protein
MDEERLMKYLQAKNPGYPIEIMYTENTNANIKVSPKPVAPKKVEPKPELSLAAFEVCISSVLEAVLYHEYYSDSFELTLNVRPESLKIHNCDEETWHKHLNKFMSSGDGSFDAFNWLAEHSFGHPYCDAMAMWKFTR